jgi:hypothetical protein
MFNNLNHKVMARISKGILGGFVGRVGTVIGSERNGQYIISSIPKKSTKAPTNAQISQRNKFGIAVGFLQPINQLLKLGYKPTDQRLSSFNEAMSYFIQNSIAGTMDNYVVDYPNVLISRGALSPAFNAVGASANPGELKINWSTAAMSGLSNPNDETICLIYNPAKSFHFISNVSALRSTGELSVLLPDDFSGDVVHCWIGFLSSDKKERSTSAYVGLVTIN